MTYECKCSICGEPGQVSQSPYPIPFSDAYCNLCYELEGIAYRVWRELNPQASKWETPFPFTKKIPKPELTWTLEEVKAYYREKLQNG